MIKKLVITLYVSLIVANQTRANDFEWTPQIQKAYTEISAIKLEKGRNILRQCPTKSAFVPYLESLAEMIEMGILENKSKYENFIEQQEQRINTLEKLDENSPYRNFLIAEIHLHTAFIQLKYGHEIKGANQVIKAYRILTKNASRFPLFLPQQKPLGILHIVIGSMPKKYQWITNLLGIKGNVRQGIQELENVVQHDSVFADEAEMFQYILSTYIIANLGDKSKALIAFVQKHPQNLAITFIGTSLLIKMGKSETALNLIKKRPVSPEYLSVPFFDYFLGEIYLQKGKYTEASNAYQDFIRNQRGFNFLKEANYKIFLCHDLNNEGKIDTKYLYNALKVGETIVEPDKIALKATQQILKTNTSISPTEKKLKKMQLATEGGYYQEGLALLEKMDESSMPKLKDRVEKIYREGRIYHLMGNTETAMVKYEKVLLLSPVQPVWSYLPRSCLYIGNIKQLQNDKKKAIYFYKKTLEYEDYEGSNGVEIKAKAGLNELQ